MKDTKKIIKGLEFVFVELPKFKPQNRSEKKLHELWLRFLTEINETTEKAPADLLENDDIREAVSYMERAAYTKAQLLYYDKWKMDTMTASSMLEQSKAEGEAIGLEKGEAIGLEKGEAIGLEKVVINCKKAGYGIDAISVVTGLTAKQITEILKKH